MSKPDIIPETTVAGIAVHPRTLERVIPESRRPDGTVRKEIKIRPGFTPQEDVSRFRGSRQQQMDQTSLPKGHIIGWAPPSSAVQATKPLSKSAKKNAKRKEKRDEKKTDETTAKIKDSWEDEDDDEAPAPSDAKAKEAKEAAAKEGAETDDVVDALAEKVQKLDVR